MVKKKYYKDIVDIGKTALVGAGLSTGLTAIGGASATSGAQGITNATRFLRPAGAVVGVKILTDEVGKVARRRKRRTTKRSTRRKKRR